MNKDPRVSLLTEPTDYEKTSPQTNYEEQTETTPIPQQSEENDFASAGAASCWKSDTLKLVLYVNGMTFFYAAMNTTGKELISNRGVDIVDFNFFKYVMIVSMTCLLLKLKSMPMPFGADSLDLDRSSKKALAINIASGCLLNLAGAAAMALLPLTINFVI